MLLITRVTVTAEATVVYDAPDTCTVHVQALGSGVSLGSDKTVTCETGLPCNYWSGGIPMQKGDTLYAVHKEKQDVAVLVTA